MARQDVDIGVQGNDGTGDSIRESFRKVNENFQELYAVFGIGGQISFTDLNDVPNTYEGNENKVPVVRSDGTGMNLLELASNNSLDGTADTIGFDYSEDGKLIVKQLSSRLANDPEPVLSGPLNASTQPIAGVSVSQEAVDIFNSVYGTNYDIGDLVIDKSFADRNYQQKQVAGGGIRLADEPETVSNYVLSSTTISIGDLVIPDHGLSDAFNGAEFIFRTTGEPPSNIQDNTSVFLRIRDSDTISLYNNSQDAISNNNKIVLNGGSGTFTITDAAYDNSLPGNWLSNVAIPRKSVVRRQGDTMEGALNLFDHPGDLAGTGLPNGSDDLQAASKLYVDNASASSQVNLYVTTSGSDSQRFTPIGKEGRAPGYAFRTINAAARMAEELIESASFDAGPYLQTLTFNNGAISADIVSAGINSPISQRTNARDLIVQNKEFIAKEVTGYIDSQYPEFAGNYDIGLYQANIQLILEAVSLDVLLGNNANYLSRRQGMRYFSNPQLRALVGTQKRQTVDSILYAKELVSRFIIQNTPVDTQYQSRVEQYIDANIVPDGNADNALSAKFDLILGIIDNGVLNAPPIVDGQTNYKINVSNGNFGFIDQANPENTDIIPGKVVRGRSSGAIAQIIDYKYEAGPRTVSVPTTDEIEVQLLQPVPFIDSEELEYGNIVKNTQVSIRVESGTYEEDYPIKIPANVSVKGDEFRRVIIRPRNRVSQSVWANTYFYRDSVFDNLVLGKSSIEEYNVFAPYDSGRQPGTYTVADWKTNAQGKNAVFSVTVSDTGTVTSVETLQTGHDFVVDEIITINGSSLDSPGSAPISITVTKVPNGLEYTNPLNNNVDGYFGYHYLTKPANLINVGAGYENVGSWDVAATAIADNQEFIQEQVVNYIESQFPYVVGQYNREQIKAVLGSVSNGISNDLSQGNNEFSLENQGNIANSAGVASYETEIASGVIYLADITKQIIRGVSPNTIGSQLEYEFDSFNGDGDPDEWQSDNIYRLGDVVKFLFNDNARYYTPIKEHRSGDIFNSTEISTYWREIDGPELVIDNLVNTVIFAFNDDYNPPLRNNQLDVFLMNDATIIRNVTVQGHGGFMCVLDPAGQVLTKSPYIQTGSSFSQSINKQAFRGGMFVDAFVGNSAVQVVGKVDGSPYRLRIQSFGSQTEPQGLFIRRPQTPCVFYVDGRRFQVNSVTNYDPDFGTAEIILDPGSNQGNGFSGITSLLTTGANLDSVGDLDIDQELIRRDSQEILQGFSYDIALGTNYNNIANSTVYRRIGSDLINSYLTDVVNAYTVGKEQTIGLSVFDNYPTLKSETETLWNDLISVIELGNETAKEIQFTPDPAGDTNKTYARQLIQQNKSFIVDETIAWINSQYPQLQYDSLAYRKEFDYKLDALSYDIQYGGNSASVKNATVYLNNVLVNLNQEQKDAALTGYIKLQSIVSQIVIESYPGQLVLSTPASSLEVDDLASLSSIIERVISEDNINSIPQTLYPETDWVTDSRKNVQTSISSGRNTVVNSMLESLDVPFAITLQTAGNRSMLGNDYTQINDLGYGLVAVNGALSEMVSMFTYYCWSSYYAKNGSEIRSLTGSSCYGEYGLIAEGSDPNEIPDAISLYEDMVQSGKTFSANVILDTSEPLILQKGDIIEQESTLASAEVAVDTAQLPTSGSRTIYLTNTSGIFDTTNKLSITGPITGDSTVTDLGPGSVPLNVNNGGFSNTQESLSIYVYDMKDVPSNRSEFDIYHPERPAFARYEVANVELLNVGVGFYERIGIDIPYQFVPGLANIGTGEDAVFTINKTIENGYSVEIINSGFGYAVGDSFTITGTQLGGSSPLHDCTIIVSQVDNGDSTIGSGLITELDISGTISIESTTPMYSGLVYKLNFSTGDAQFSDTGLLEDVGFNKIINYRRNQTHILSDISKPDTLTIRPSTAVIFKENPGFVYRSISFLSSDSIGNQLPDDALQAGFDSTYDYIRLIVDGSKAQESELSGNGTTKGGTTADTRIALLPVADDNEIFRLNNNENTPIGNRPIGWTSESLTTPSIFTWGGKKHYVFNYRGVDVIGGVATEVPPAEDNDYAMVDIVDAGQDINYPKTSSGLASPVTLGSEVVTIRAGLEAGSLGDVTIKISTCRATGHDFLDIGTGGFNASNYPNVIFGEPNEKDGSKEVEERGKGRVFYVSTDQNGVFRVGRFFSVDQGTGTVSFSASIALSDVDGIGFKRGVVVTEFSTDSAMIDNASDTVPTELAVRGYVNRRLGYDLNGTPVSNKIGPGVLAPNGSVPMTDDLNAAGNTITNLSAPSTSSDAATKSYVDSSKDDNDELKDLRSLEYNDYAEGQLIVGTGYKKLIIDGNTVVGGSFIRGNEFTGSITGATGQIIDVTETSSVGENLIEITYTVRNGVISDGKPAGDSPDADTIVVNSGARGLVIDGPIDEWANGVWNPASDIQITTNRELVTDGSVVTSRYTSLNAQIKPNTIVNSDVSGGAGIIQSKLNLNSATVKESSTPLSQSDLGVATFDSDVFSSENGWITITPGSISIDKISGISENHVLANTIDSTNATVDEIPFSAVVSLGNGLEDTDFEVSREILSNEDPGFSLIKTSEGVYGISNVTKIGESNSIVKTDNNGSIRITSLKLGGSDEYEIISLDSTTVNIKTPAQGEILRATGGTGGSNPSYPNVEVPGSLSVGLASTDDSILKNTSTLSDKETFAADWIYSSFIEALSEKGNASSGISIGQGTGVTATGEVAVVTADSVTNSSVSPFIFSATGVVPDTDQAYNIGSENRKYDNVYANLFRGTATESFYADLAENYLSDDYYENGTVLVLGGVNEVTIGSQKGTSAVLGVVSTNPAHLMNSHLVGDYVLPVALQGRTPCKVIGKVAKGDLIVCSSVPGHGMTDNYATAGTIIGKAMEDKDTLERGVIEVVIGKC